MYSVESKTEPGRLVSVVMSVYNGERFLREAVDSILSQSFREFEFVVIDDGSTDGSAGILDAYRDRDSRLRVFHRENRGLIESLNYGCTLAAGKYIARMDADDIAVRDRLERQIDFLEAHPEVAVLGGAVEFMDASGKTLATTQYPADDQEIQRRLLHECPIQHPAVMMRRDVMKSVGGYRHALTDAEDYDLWMRIGERTQLANLEQVVLRYRIHVGQVSLKKRRQQTLGFLAAQAAAEARRRGDPDLMDSFAAVTPAVLTKMGVSEAVQQTTLVRHYLGWIRSMVRVKEYAAALETAKEMLSSSDWRQAEKWALADVLLEVSRLYWRKGNFLRSLMCLGRAIKTRPVVIGRPFRALLRLSTHLS